MPQFWAWLVKIFRGPFLGGRGLVVVSVGLGDQVVRRRGDVRAGFGARVCTVPGGDGRGPGVSAARGGHMWGRAGDVDKGE